MGQKQPPAGGWQPIETAPKQERVLLYSPPERLSDRADQKPDWRVARAADFTWATHWQPLPAPPAAAAEQTETRAVKAERVHAMVNSTPLSGMSEAFDAYIGASAWIDPAYRGEASLWAAAWKAALAARNAALPPAEQTPAPPSVPKDGA